MDFKLSHGFALSVFMALWLLAPSSILAEDMPATPEEWAMRVQKMGKAVPQEQVFVHMDNTSYFLGDTLYYKAYVTRPDGGKALSRVLYCDLYNQDGYQVEHQIIELTDGQGAGSFALADTLYGGFYELRAYTKWQLNFGKTTFPHTKDAERYFFRKQMADEFFSHWEKLYSRVFPVYDKPKEAGVWDQNMTYRPMERYFKLKDPKPHAVVTLFPEGGSLLETADCRLAVEANDEEGQHLQGTLEIKDAARQTIATCQTDARGRGALTFTPQKNNRYTAQFTWKEGTEQVEVPDVETDGCALRVEPKGNEVELHLQPRGAACTQAMGITVMSGGVQHLFMEFDPLSADTTLVIPSENLRTGVNQVTLFTSDGRVWADRLFFSFAGFDLADYQVEIEGLSKGPQKPYEKMSVSLKGKPGSTLSVAVRDARHSDYLYDSGSILTEMLLSSEIRGFVENPGYYFEDSSDTRRAELDLLLMIQGWRRHKWKTMATPGLFTLQFMPEETPRFSGRVYPYSSSLNANAQILEAEDEPMEGQPEEQTDTRESDNETISRQRGLSLKRQVLLHAEFMKPNSEPLVGDQVTENDRFHITSPRFFEGCYFWLAASDTVKNQKTSKNWVVMGEDEKGDPVYPEFYVKLDVIKPRHTEPYNWYQTHVAIPPQGSLLDDIWSEDAHTLAEITVGASRGGRRIVDFSKPAYVVDAYEAFNECVDAGLISGVFPGSHPFLRALANTYVGDMNLTREYEIRDYYDGKRPMSLSYAELEKFNHLPNLQTVKIYTDFCPRLIGDRRYEGANQPIVSISLERIPQEGRQVTYRDRFYYLKGFSTEYEFYQPRYETTPLPSHQDYRRTLYWNPDVKLDAQGKARLEFYSNGQETPMIVSAEGLTPDREPQTGTSYPETR